MARASRWVSVTSVTAVKDPGAAGVSVPLALDLLMGFAAALPAGVLESAHLLGAGAA